MKRAIGIVVGVLSIGTMIYVGASLWAQPGTGTPAATQPVAAPLRTPVRVVNMSKVVKNYNKWKNFQLQYKDAYKKEYEDKVAPQKAKMTELVAIGLDPKSTPAQKQTAEKAAKKIQHEVGEIGEEAKQKLAKMQADVFVLIYKDIEATVYGFARQGAIELVMFYSDATDASDMYAIGNIERKLGNGALMPMYAEAGMDISDRILGILNSQVPDMTPKGAPPAGSGAAVPPVPGVPIPGKPNPIQPIGGIQRP